MMIKAAIDPKYFTDPVFIAASKDAVDHKLFMGRAISGKTQIAETNPCTEV